MPTLWIAIIASAAVIVLLELVLWHLFARNGRALMLAHDRDASAFGLWTIGRLRIFAIVHTIIMLLCVVSFLFWVW